MRAAIEKAYGVLAVLLLILIATSKQTCAIESAKTTRLSTGIVIQRLFIDSAGQFACVFGQPQRTRHRISSSFTGPPTQLVIVDLQKGSILTQCPSVGEIRTALVDGEQILWVPKNVNLLKRLRFDGSDHAEEIVLDASVEKIFGLGPELFGMVSRSDRNNGIVSIYDRKTLKEVETHPLSRMPLSLVRGRDPIVQLGDSMLYLNERIVNLPYGTNRCFTLKGRQPPQIGGVRKQIIFPSHDSFGDTYWRRHYKRSDVVQFAGTGNIPITSSWSWISKMHPLLATLDFSPDRHQRTATLYVELQDLVHGQVLRRVNLPESVKLEHYRLPHKQTAVRMGGNTILITVWDEVFITKLPMQYVEKNVLDPLRLLYPTIPIVDIPQLLNFQLSAKGGKAPLRFELGSDVPGMSINSSTGKVTVDYSEGWHTFCETISKSKHRYYGSGPNAVYFNGMLSSDFFGTKAVKGKMLVSLPVEFTVSDQSGQKDRIFVSLIAKAPIDQYKKAKQSGENPPTNRLPVP